MAAFWLPVASIIAVAFLAANSDRLTGSIYWTLTSVLIIILGTWKFMVRRRIANLQMRQPTSELIEELRPTGYFFLTMYFLIAVAFLGYGGVVWHYQLDHSWAVFITFICIWVIRYEVWATLVGFVSDETHPPQQNSAI